MVAQWGNPGQAGIGGVIRDCSSHLISFPGPFGFCSINEDELLTHRMGLREASRLNLLRLLVEGNSKCVICWGTNSWKLLDAVEEVAHLSRSLGATFSHMPRSANGVADALTMKGAKCQSLHISYQMCVLT
eukprot:TRINITY_DN5842_c0_g2_i3.p1 TRINITY_DN5842_c0_g2~~TRINITY_DN5842_c0_g2_i3.p1  ORF type:complete len:131 (+),score=11.11 TRINITY_DN5842_c0_g2_i3:78-470(+)